jgi:hemolysin D
MKPEQKTSKTKLERLTEFDASFRRVTTAMWDRIVAFFSIPSKDPALDYLSKADRIQAEPIARSAPIALYAILLFIVIILLWAALSSVDRVTSARGRIVSDEANIVMQVEENSEIVEFNLRVGQKVKKDQVLMRLDPTISEADRQEVTLRLDSLEKELSDLTSERQAVASPERPPRVQTDTRYLQTILQLRESVRLAEDEVQVAEARLQTAEQVNQMNEELIKKNFASKRMLLESEDRRLGAEKEAIASKTRLNALRRDLTNTITALNTRILELTRERDSLSQRLIKAERRAEKIALVAPRDAIVLEFSKLSKGSVARAMEQLITLVPANAKMRVEASVSSADIAGIKIGQSAKVKLDTFAFQRYGYLEGKVTNITRDSVEVQTAEGVQRVYPLVIEVKEFRLRGGQTEDTIVPGMTLTAEIITGNRSIISYLFDPLLKAVDESMNE